MAGREAQIQTDVAAEEAIRKKQREDKISETHDNASEYARINRKWRPWVDWARFTFVSLNFILSVVFAMILVAKAFIVDDIEGLQVFHTDRVLQSSGLQPPEVIDNFVKHACGIQSEIFGVASRVVDKAEYLPRMFEVAGSNSMLRLEAVHSSFMLFSALWISSAFSLAMAQFPNMYALYWSEARVVVVHVWNLVGIVLTLVIFTGTTRWKQIPLSNLFYSLIGQAMAWVYQYFHMVECTQSLASNDLSMRYVTTLSNKDERGNVRKFSYYSTELRKLMFMEFSVVAPMFLVAGIMPGMIGIDEWRIQTVLFSSWSLFALLGLHLRFRKALKRNMSNVLKISANGDSATDDDSTHGYDALGYLTYAIVIVFIMLLNAMGRTSFYGASYGTPSISSARWGSRTLVIVSAVLVLEAVVLAVVVRCLPHLAQREKIEELATLRNRINKDANNAEKPTPTLDDNQRGQLLEDIDPHLRWSFIFNIVIIGFGSVMVKVLVFAGLSDTHALSHS